MTKLFAEGQKVRLLSGTQGVADNADVEVAIPAGTIGTVTCVRETSDPKSTQGPWLYDVEFPCEAKGAHDLVWAIYDATDAHELEAAA